MSDLSIIFVVAIAGIVGSALIALAVYLIDKNVDQRDKHS